MGQDSRLAPLPFKPVVFRKNNSHPGLGTPASSQPSKTPRDGKGPRQAHTERNTIASIFKKAGVQTDRASLHYSPNKYFVQMIPSLPKQHVLLYWNKRTPLLRCQGMFLTLYTFNPDALNFKLLHVLEIAR